MVVTLVKLRHNLPDTALAELFGVDRSTISGAIRQVRRPAAGRPGRKVFISAALHAEGIVKCFRRYPEVEAEVDEGYRGLAIEFPGQVSAPPRPMTKKARETAPLGDLLAWCEARRRQSSRRIRVEHANAE